MNIWGIRVILLAIIFITCVTVLEAQSDFPYKFIDPACEDVRSFMEIIAKESIKNKERIFVISSRGKNEKYKISKSRLDKVYYEFTVGLGVKSEEIVISTGPKNSTEKGKIEFYLGSKFYLILIPREGRNVCLTTGDIDPSKIKTPKSKKSIK